LLKAESSFCNDDTDNFSISDADFDWGSPYQTDRYVTDICHSSVKYLQNICTKVSVTYLQHIGIWPHNISVTVM
jgi:hypothetical protein